MRWALALLLCVHYAELPSPQVIFEKLQDLKTAFDAEKKHVSFEQLSEFPEEPADLPPHIYKAVYTDTACEPVPLAVKGINTTGELIPLRGNSKLLSQKRNNAQSTAFKTAKQSLSAEPSSVSERAETGEVTPEPCAKNEPIEPHPGIRLTDIAHVEKDVLCHTCQARVEHVRSNVHAHHPSCTPIKDEPVESGTPAASTTAISVSRSDNGSLVLKPRTQLSCLTHDTRKNEPQPADDTAAQPVVSFNDLDEYTQAAVSSLGKRHAAKKEHAAAKSILKRPAVAVKADHGASKTPKLEKGPDAAVKKEVEEVSKTHIMSRMPSSKPSDIANPAPVHYNGGVIYTSWKSKRFRALTTRGDVYTEKPCGWHSTADMKDAWRSCVTAIDEARK